ncbi:MAG: preprotein translocase subunit SecE [Thermodesulfobacteriota bacterium]|nr:preprotein translocase subunit SecE [Thermodesulfobacteriota bacterium]
MARLQKKKTTAEKVRQKESHSKDLSVSDGAATSGGKAGSAVSKVKKLSRSGDLSKKGAAGSGVAQDNFFQKGMQFFREVRIELKKVTWPTRKQTAGSTVVVIILVFILSAFLGVVDFGLSKLVQVVLA